MIQDTSIKAFRQEVVPTLSERHQMVMEALADLGSATNNELAKALGWSINRVTPRIHELRGQGMVASIGKRPDQVTGRTAYVWSIKAEQLPLPKKKDPGMSIIE